MEERGTILEWLILGITYCCQNKETVRQSESATDYVLNPLTPNDHYSGRTAPLTSKRFILYIYSTNLRTEYFKHGIYSPFFSLQNAVCFIIQTYLVPVLFTFYIQGVLKLKNNSGAKRLTTMYETLTGKIVRRISTHPEEQNL